MKILVAQADEASREMLKATLTKWEHEVIVAPDGARAWQELHGQSVPKLAILDGTMPGMDGLQICRELRRRTDQAYIYVLLTLAAEQQPRIVEAVTAGADDCVVKPITEDQLVVRLRIGKRLLELQEELRRAHEAIGYQTTHDPLTGLWNRAAVLDALVRELARVQREGTPVGIILAELDNLRSINDTFGHLAGDAVLRSAARRIRALVRPYDTVGRYGGEEFLVIVPGCDARNAQSQGDRIRAALAGETVDLSEWGKFASAKDGKIMVTLSMGVAAGTQVKAAEPLLRAAEAALARAKQAGQNRTEVAAEAEIK